MADGGCQPFLAFDQSNFKVNYATARDSVHVAGNVFGYTRQRGIGMT